MVELIEAEIDRKQQANRPHIMAQFIRWPIPNHRCLYEASQAG